VIVLIGANDYWTVRIPFDAIENAARRSFLERHSRIYKLYYHLFRTFSTTQFDVSFDDRQDDGTRGDANRRGATGTARFGDAEFSLGWVPIAAEAKHELQDAPQQLEANLKELSAQAKAFDTDFWLLTYPTHFQVYQHANKVIRRSANASDIQLVDMEELFSPLCPKHACPDYLFQDQHPNAAGYRLMAETLMLRLRDR
jgi:lysophospholipase L1-like esterase